MNPAAPTSFHRSSAATPAMTTVAGYLLTRLTEAGVISAFGVPGDYNLGILDAIAAPPLLRDLARVLATSDSYSG